MIRVVVYIFFLGAGLLACSSLSLKVTPVAIAVVEESDDISQMDELIVPYTDSVEMEMNEILAELKQDLISNRKPSGNLSNWVADAIFVNQTKHVRLKEPAFCLLNHGGIRATLNKGQITRGDMFKVMPFDNEIVWVRMPIEYLPEIAVFLRERGGDPISSAIIDKNGLQVNGVLERTTHVWIITSDYLLNGGDNMIFFKKGSELNRTGKLMRDALIEEAIDQKVLTVDDTNRMQF
jgi:2',3'-cyclic-nucleotide 2'-phosphodiesterase (5'-nucleotidase family)